MPNKESVEDKKLKEEALLSAFMASNALLLSIFKNLDEKITKLRSQGLTYEEIIQKLLEHVETSVNAYWLTNFWMPVQTTFINKIINTFKKRDVNLYRYHTQMDDRVRRSHRLLEGNVYDANTSLGKRMKPPIAILCRCYTSPVSNNYKGIVQKKLPEVNPFGEGFGHDAWSLHNKDGKYPLKLWKQYLKIKNRR